MSSVSNFAEMRPLGAMLIHADRQMDLTIGTFYDYVKMTKMNLVYIFFL
jgi:hypothetical protein